MAEKIKIYEDKKPQIPLWAWLLPLLLLLALTAYFLTRPKPAATPTTIQATPTAN